MDPSEDHTHVMFSSDDNDDLGKDSLNLADQDEPRRAPRRRQATVYDAVAGRVSYRALHDGEIVEEPRFTKHHTKGTPYAPEEVLFRRKDAPERYAEHDVYHAHDRDIPRGGQAILPESDLVKAVHGYSSKFYGALARNQPQPDGRSVDFRSMDETALLAFGLLLEEASRDVLGKRGDLIFTEGADDVGDSGGDEVARQNPSAIGHNEVGSWKKGGRRSKRLKVSKSEDT